MCAAATNIQQVGLGYRYGLAIGIGLVLSTAVRRLQDYLVERQESRIVRAPRRLLDQLSGNEMQALPYTPNSLPGGRLVDTPYGSMQVYEWGPLEGDKVLLLPGISTPVPSLGNLGEGLVRRGYRVMMFDLYGRGWSDNPTDVPHDEQLYVSQIMFALASSQLSWTGSSALHLFGYSLGGGLAISFARYFPDMLKSLSLLAPAGLIRRDHLNWRGRLLYSRASILPEWLLTLLVKKRLEPPVLPAAVVSLPSSKQSSGNGDASGGNAFDQAVIWPDRPQVTVAALVSWQLKHHSGFPPAFMSTMRHAPIFEQQEAWSVVAGHMEKKRRNDSLSHRSARRNGVVLLIQGTEDTVILPSEMVADAEAVFGKEGVDTVLLEGGHEIPITKPKMVADALVSHWTQES
ncbi:alpha/beta-hydrolase [Rhypophila decipiens]|uniref:Alpha/beta-hydrolase n=1 Tax=Rhypophila decipiens TaxID=261697 RepID=A0AAN6YGG1_9PEZI|nr:alpha/beta-hydrolase [Rhypophila decipiens]